MNQINNSEWKQIQRQIINGNNVSLIKKDDKTKNKATNSDLN